LREIKKEKNNTIIVVEHSLEHLVPLADRILLLDQGQVVLFEETQTFFEQMPMLLERGINPPGVLEFFHKLRENNGFADKLPLTVKEATEMMNHLLQHSAKER